MDLLIHAPRENFAASMIEEEKAVWSVHFERFERLLREGILVLVRFYQRRGFRLRALRLGAVDAARRDLKPQIAAVGNEGIALRDELELELPLR